MKHDTQSGFTLVELLLYAALLGILFVGISSFFSLTLEARVKNQSISEVNQQGIFILENMAQTIRNATEITAPASGMNASSLTVTVPTSSLSPTVYSLSGTTLQIKEGTAAPIPLNDAKLQITNLNFSNLSRAGTSGIVQISFTLSRINNLGRNEYDYQKTFTTSVALRQ